MSNIIDSMPSILIGIDAFGKVTQWNKTTEQTTGISASAAQGQNLSVVFPRIESEIKNIIDSIQSRETIRKLKKTHNNEDLLFENLTVYPLTADDIKGAVIRIDDVTREKKLEEQLSQSQKMDAIGQLAGGIAHDFNNMLGGIMGAAELLKLPKRNIDQKGIELVDLILIASKQAADLTAKLLALGHKSKVFSTVVDIHKIIDDTIAILNRTIDRKIKLILTKEAESHNVIGNSSSLQNILLNLGINAAHAMTDSGIIQIKTKNSKLDKSYCEFSPFDIKPGEYIEIEIRDSGCGISSENMKKIFEPFFTTKDQGKGSGLGLAAVYGTVKSHQGAVTIDSLLNVGTSFHVFLPCSKKTADPEHSDVEIQYGTGQILLIDDEKIIRKTGKGMLEEMGYKVITAKNGKEGVDVYRNMYKEIDIIIMDMIMPEMNGREAFLKMKEINKNCKVIIASSFAKKEVLDELDKADLSGFISKPFNYPEMGKLISEVLSKEH